MKEGTGKFLTSVFALLLTFSICILPIFCVEKVNAEEHSSWITLAPLPATPTSIQGIAALNGKIYYIGGNTTMQYNPETNNWTDIAPLPISNSWGTVVAYQNKIYLIGGSADVPTQVYDPATDTWENRASIPSTRSDPEANVVDGKIYVISGQKPSGLSIINPSISNDVYDPETDSWSKMAPIPVPVMGYASAVLDDKIYIISGGYEGGPNYNPTNLVQIFDPATNQWTNGTSIPVAVAYARACATTGTSAPKRIYVIGGTRNYYYRWATFGATNLNQIYVPETDTWINGTSMPTPRCFLGVAVLDDEIFAIGGIDGESDINANEKYTPQADPIPELSSLIILPLILTATVFLIIVKRKLNKVKAS